MRTTYLLSVGMLSEQGEGVNVGERDDKVGDVITKGDDEYRKIDNQK